MWIVVPLLDADAFSELPGFLRVITKAGACHAHGMLVLVAEDIEDDPAAKETLLEFRDESSRLFAHVDVVRVKSDRNRAFRVAADIMSGKPKSALGWMWMEGCYPLVVGWLDRLEFEYRNCGKRYLGVVDSAYFQPQPGKFELLGRFMRTGVYPLDLINHSVMLKQTVSHEPFEYEIRFEMRKQIAETESIIHLWASQGFRKDESRKLTGDQKNESEIRHVLPQDDSKACLVKVTRWDHSLADLLKNRRWSAQKAPDVLQVIQTDEGLVEALAAKESELRDLKGYVSVLEGRLAELAGRVDTALAEMRECLDDTNA